MAQPKFSTFIVAMIMVSAAVSVMALMMSEFSTNYDVTYSDNESPAVISKLDELRNLTKDVRAETYPDPNEEDEKKNIITHTVDILGELFNTGYTAIRTVATSYEVFTTMTDSGLSSIGLGESYATIRTAIISSVLVIILIGIVIAILVKRNV